MGTKPWTRHWGTDDGSEPGQTLTSVTAGGPLPSMQGIIPLPEPFLFNPAPLQYLHYPDRKKGVWGIEATWKKEGHGSGVAHSETRINSVPPEACLVYYPSQFPDFQTANMSGRNTILRIGFTCFQTQKASELPEELQDFGRDSKR